MARDIVRIAFIVLASRALLATVGLVTIHLADTGSAASLVARWDGGWYLSIIRNGYSVAEVDAQLGATNYAFFPLYPMLVRGIVAATGLPGVWAGAALSLACFFLACVLIHHYALALGYTARTGLRAVVLINVVPQSIIFSALYSEALFVMLLAAALLAMRREHHWLAAGAAALLSATRPTGVLFVVFAGAHLLLATPRQTLLAPWRDAQRFLPLAAAPFGLVGYWWFSYLTTGDAFAQATTAAHGWTRMMAPPWRMPPLVATSWEAAYWIIGSLVAFAFSLALVRLRLFADWLYCLANFLLVWSMTVPHSLVRYVIVLVPIYVGTARILAGRPRAYAALVAGLALISTLMMIAWSYGALIAI